jgi:hypothetical protein
MLSPTPGLNYPFAFLWPLPPTPLAFIISALVGFIRPSFPAFGASFMDEGTFPHSKAGANYLLGLTPPPLFTVRSYFAFQLFAPLSDISIL